MPSRFTTSEIGGYHLIGQRVKVLRGYGPDPYDSVGIGQWGTVASFSPSAISEGEGSWVVNFDPPGIPSRVGAEAGYLAAMVATEVALLRLPRSTFESTNEADNWMENAEDNMVVYLTHSD